jgi:microcin C transport system permease protein
VLFGLTLTVCRRMIGIAAGAVQGYFGGWTDLFQRFIEIWSSMPVLYPADHRAVLPPNFWILLGHHAAVFLGRVCRRRAGGIPARAQFRICQRRPGAGRGQPHDHVPHLLPNAMVATLTFLPFILSGSITTLTSLDFLGFGLPPGSPRWAN